MNISETFEMMNNATNESYANLRKLADINLNVWDQLASKQMEVMKLCFETGNKQLELSKDVKRVDELLGKQAVLAREFGEQLVASNQEVADILSKSRGEYQGWIDAGIEQLKGRMEQAVPAKPRKSA